MIGNTYKLEILNQIYLFVCIILSIGSVLATVLNVGANAYWLYIGRQLFAANYRRQILASKS